MSRTDLETSLLGKEVGVPKQYAPGILQKIMRRRSEGWNRPMYGADRWLCYELTWLGASGGPAVAVMQIDVPANSRFLVESKSLKLYLMSFANERFDAPHRVAEIIRLDLTRLLEVEVVIALYSPEEWGVLIPQQPVGVDLHDISIRNLPEQPMRELLRVEKNNAVEQLYYHGFRGICPVTGQPDYATVLICYGGLKLERRSLVEYLTSFRNHPGFHEECCERIFQDLGAVCVAEQLVVECCFTRRGGIEINPLRSSAQDLARPLLRRTFRQ